jgi:hypothetical protein
MKPGEGTQLETQDHQPVAFFEGALSISRE